MSVVTHFSLAQYELMVESGAFDGKNRQRVEFIRGEIREMSPIGTEHAEMISRLADWSYGIGLAESVKFRIQLPVRISALESEPEPDVVWAKRKDYSEQHPEPDDVLLLIEVADSSLAFDTGEKAQLYAEAGIRDYWVVNLIDKCVEVFRDPTATGYKSRRKYRAEEEIKPLAFAEATLRAAQLFKQ